MALRDFLPILREHQARLDRVTDKRTLPEVRKLYNQAGRELDQRLKALSRSGRGDTMTAYQARVLKAQVRQAQVTNARRLTGTLGDVSREAQAEGLRGLGADVTRLERRFTGAEIVVPTEEAARFQGVIDQRRTSLLAMHSESMAAYGARTIGEMEDQISLSLATGQTTGEAIDRVLGTFDGAWWQAERIVRTETAWAYNASYSDGIDAAAEGLPDLMKRWAEHVDDYTYRPLDDRVGVDSIAMHGQVTDPDGVFTMPATAPRPDAKGKREVSDSLVGESWEYPPNRPNDRAVVSPWRPHWGIPGWRYSAGRRVPLR